MAECIGKHLTASPIGISPRDAYAIRGKQDRHLGYVEWHVRWRCYVFTPEPGLVLNADCMRDLARFCERSDAREATHA